VSLPELATSPLRCDEQALPQVGEQLGFLGDLFEMATQFSREHESLWPKRYEVVALVEGCVFLLLAPLSQGCHCTFGDTW